MAVSVGPDRAIDVALVDAHDSALQLLVTCCEGSTMDALQVRRCTASCANRTVYSTCCHCRQSTFLELCKCDGPCPEVKRCSPVDTVDVITKTMNCNCCGVVLGAHLYRINLPSQFWHVGTRGVAASTAIRDIQTAFAVQWSQANAQLCDGGVILQPRHFDVLIEGAHQLPCAQLRVTSAALLQQGATASTCDFIKQDEDADRVLPEKPDDIRLEEVALGA